MWLIHIIWPFLLINVALCWNKCTQFRVQQYLCNGTEAYSISESLCASYPRPNCFYDSSLLLCICKYYQPCLSDVPDENEYKILKLDYLISFQLDNNNQGTFLASNLTYEGETSLNSSYYNGSILPTGFSVDYRTHCDGPQYITRYLLKGLVSLFNETQNLNFTYNCDSYDYLSFHFYGTPIYNYSTPALFLYQYKGTYYAPAYINSSLDGTFLNPQSNSFQTYSGNITCVSFEAIPEPPKFSDQCTQYMTRSWYNNITVLNVTYAYMDGNVTLSASTGSLVNTTYIGSNIYVEVAFDGSGFRNMTQSISRTLTNYLHRYDHSLTLLNASFIFYYNIVVYNGNSYKNETAYFTYNDNCNKQILYDNSSNSYLTNEFCCIEWKTAGTVSPPPNNPTTTYTQSSLPNNPTTTSTQLTTSHTTSGINACQSSWKMGLLTITLAYIITMESGFALLTLNNLIGIGILVTLQIPQNTLMIVVPLLRR